MKHLTRNIKFLLVMFLFISFTGCDEDDEVELPEVVAGFTHTINQSTGTVTFINTSTDADSYSWDFGDDTTSTEINPIKSYESGTYTIVLTSENAAGSVDTFEDTIVIDIPLPVSLPITFDDENTIYEAMGFNGAAFEVLANPDPSGSNATVSNVGALTNSGNAFEGIFFNLGAPINLETDKTIEMDFWSDTAIDVLMKLENPNGSFIEVATPHTGSGWESMIFTFGSSDSFSVLTLFADAPGTAAGTFYLDNVAQIATVDNAAPVITLIGDAELIVFLGSTFEDPGATATDNIDGDISANIIVGGDVVDTNTIAMYTITYDVSDASGNAADQVTRVVNVTEVPTGPIMSAPLPPNREPEDVVSIYGESYTNILVNNYDPDWGQSGHMMVQTDYNPGDGNLALAYLNFDYQGTDLGAPYDLSEMEFLHVDIWVASDVDRQVRVSPINAGTGANEVQIEVPVTPGSWSSVDLPIGDFTGMTWDAVNQMIFNGQFNADGSANTTPYDIYLDNIYFYKGEAGGGGGGGGDPIQLPFTFEEGATPPFIAFDGGATVANIPNPDTNGNSSDRVLEFNKVMGSEWYSGFVYDDTLPNGPLVDLANGQMFTMKIWSPTAGVNLRFQIEDNDSSGAGNPTSNRDVTIPVANEWVTLTIDFTVPDGTGDPGSIPNPIHTFKRIAVFPDFDPANQVPVNPGAIYYIDDIVQQ